MQKDPESVLDSGVQNLPWPRLQQHPPPSRPRRLRKPLGSEGAGRRGGERERGKEAEGSQGGCALGARGAGPLALPAGTGRLASSRPAEPLWG